MSGEKQSSKSSAQDFVETYLSLGVQPAEEATTDTQLATVVLSLSEKIDASSSGTIIDIGCGEGTLLRRLCELDAFKSGQGWIYVGIDEEERIEQVQNIARRERISRRVELFNLNEFYEKWPDVSGSQIIICRNVLHELRIADTGQLLHHIGEAAGKFDSLIIQDLVRFPVSERHNACWIPEELFKVFVELGFTPQNPVLQGTRNGNAFFNLIAGPPRNFAATQDDVEKVVAAARSRQWQTWMEIEGATSQSLPVRDELIDALDIDLQLTALTRQLRDVGILASLSPDVEKRVRTAEFTRVVEAGLTAGLASNFQVEERFHFRERGAQLTILEEFLRLEGRLALVHGGSGYGKTTLVHRLLMTRSYGKIIVEIDGKRTKSAWAFLESMFSQVGIRLAAEQLSVLGNLSMASVAPTLGNFLNRTASNLIIFFDDFDQVLTPKGELQDPELMEILRTILSKERVKVLLASRKEFIPGRLVEASESVPALVRVGRYATVETVVNILDDYFDRSSAGLTEYPSSLLAAIDRHPLITSLAARVLQKEGDGLLLDSTFVSELTHKLREELWGRIVSVEARDAVSAAANLRVGVPLPMLESIADREAVFAARDEEAIYPTPDSRWKAIWSTLGLFRVREAEVEGFREVKSEQTVRGALPDHSKIASLYRSLYRNDDDPKWIRESYYHQLLSNDGESQSLTEGMGSYYYDELVSSADYHFKRSHDYASALELFNHAKGIRPLKQDSEMRRASCLVRLGETEEGENAYRELVKANPDQLSIKTSHVDAVLYRHEYERAEKILTDYGLSHEKEWVEWQWGRIYLGLDNYEKAITYLSRLAGNSESDAHYVIHLARALDFSGDFRGAFTSLDAARRKFSSDVAVQTAFGVALQRIGDSERATEVLGELLERYPDNIHAAAALIKMEIAKGDVSAARDILRRAGPIAPTTLRNLVSCAHADLEVAESKPEMALARLERIAEPDPLVCVGIVEALRSAVERTLPVPATEKKARNYTSPDRYRLNARVQIAVSELALVVQNRPKWDKAISNLEATRLDHAALDKLRGRWPS